MFSQMKHGGQPAAAIRRLSLERNSRYWKLLRSNVDCFICLQRKPEHLTSCGHGICDTCVGIGVFSQPTRGRESCYDLSVCPQCRAEICFQARVLPKTCRVRFLAFDGGGSRGIVSLAFMDHLRMALGLRYPVQENFDYAIGTSSGQQSWQAGEPQLTRYRRRRNHRTLWQILGPKEMHRILPKVCAQYLPIQAGSQAFYLRHDPALLFILS